MPTNAKTVFTHMSETEALERGIVARSRNRGFPVPEDYKDAIEKCRNLEVQRDELLEALKAIIEMNIVYCVDKYGDASMAESMSCVKTARAAIAKAGAQS